MQGPSNETVGEKFNVSLLQSARDKTLQVITETASKLKAGMTESDAQKIIEDLQHKLGSKQNWHLPQIRFGENTLLAFGKKGVQNIPLKDDDIYFLDLGPVFDSHEGDVGRAYAIGNNPEMQRCCRDVETIWRQVRNHWAETNQSGEELYNYATACAEKLGWLLARQQANGHRISDFPHAIRIRGSIEGFHEKPAPNRWILEIQIRHPTKSFGAFYEDLLN